MADTASPQTTAVKSAAASSKRERRDPEALMAPSDVMVWYLAVFHRLFAGMEQASGSDDLEDTWLLMWAADAVHNVPSAIKNYYSPSEWRNPQDEGAWVRSFPDFLMAIGAPERHYEPAKRLVSQEGAPEELGLTDSSVADFPQREELEKQLDQLYHLCLYLRQRMPREALDEEGWQSCAWYRGLYGILGPVAKRLPLGLVHWTGFDSARFEADLEEAYSKLRDYGG